MPWSATQAHRLRRLFVEGFPAMDTAEPPISFDAQAGDLVPDTANLIDVVKSLSINARCFVVVLDRAVASSR